MARFGKWECDRPSRLNTPPRRAGGHDRPAAPGGDRRRLLAPDLFRVQAPQFPALLFGQLVSLIGTWMTSTAQGWLVYQLTGSKALLGIVAAAGSAPMLFFSTWGGWVADRFPKRSVLVCTQIAMMLSLLCHGRVWFGEDRSALANHRARPFSAESPWLSTCRRGNRSWSKSPAVKTS